MPQVGGSVPAAVCTFREWNGFCGEWPSYQCACGTQERAKHCCTHVHAVPASTHPPTGCWRQRRSACAPCPAGRPTAAAACPSGCCFAGSCGREGKGAAGFSIGVSGGGRIAGRILTRPCLRGFPAAGQLQATASGPKVAQVQTHSQLLQQRHGLGCD